MVLIRRLNPSDVAAQAGKRGALVALAVGGPRVEHCRYPRRASRRRGPRRVGARLVLEDRRFGRAERSRYGRVVHSRTAGHRGSLLG